MKKDSKSQTALKYASALYEGAERDKVIPKVQKDIEKITETFKGTVIKDLSNPVWPLKSKKAALQTVSKKLGLTEETLKFLHIVAENNHFGELGLIFEEFGNIYNREHNIVPVVIQTVKPLSPAQDKKLRNNLEKYLGKKVIVAYEVKPQILGGLVISFADKLLDDSIAGKLNQLELIMKGD